MDINDGYGCGKGTKFSDANINSINASNDKIRKYCGDVRMVRKDTIYKRSYLAAEAGNAAECVIAYMPISDNYKISEIKGSINATEFKKVEEELVSKTISLP